VNMNLVPAAAFASGLLNKDYHERLLADLPQLVEKANVPLHAVWSRLSEYCTEEEVNWVRTLRGSPDSGLAFVGKTFKVVPEDKMMAITGACMRNYTDARVYSVQEVIARLKSDSMPMPTVLLVPNFCLDKDSGGDMPSWEITHLMGLLLTRSSKGLKTILYCSSMTSVEKQYGDNFRKHLEAKYALATPSEVKTLVEETAS
jgi:hypothetical protein